MLNSGTNVICDRYAYSGAAYSMAKGLNFEWCKGVDSELVQPDLTIYFQIGADALSKRNGFGKEKLETVEFQRQVEQGYRRFTDCGISDSAYMAVKGTQLINRWINLDLSKEPSIANVASRITQIITKY